MNSISWPIAAVFCGEGQADLFLLKKVLRELIQRGICGVDGYFSPQRGSPQSHREHRVFCGKERGMGGGFLKGGLVKVLQEVFGSRMKNGKNPLAGRVNCFAEKNKKEQFNFGFRIGIPLTPLPKGGIQGGCGKGFNF
jgi:hypothetical protein